MGQYLLQFLPVPEILLVLLVLLPQLDLRHPLDPWGRLRLSGLQDLPGQLLLWDLLDLLPLWDLSAPLDP